MKFMPISVAALVLLPLLSACSTDNAGNSIKSAGGAAASAAKGAVSLVNVNLSNVLNNLALDLKVDKANIPINAQIPITIAANICGVSLNVLSASSGGSPNCTAQSTSPQLSQAVQQQMAANGSVGGGSQSGAAALTPAPGPVPTASARAAPPPASGTTAPTH